MKKIVVLLGLLFIGLAANADFMEIETNVNMVNFWEKNGKAVQKVTEVSSKIISANKLEKRIPIQVKRNLNTINAYSLKNDKTVNIFTGLLPYVDNDDELAYILGHEMGHSLDAYDGVVKWIAMTVNSKAYEYKADLIGVDLMTKAGYNPVAAITEMNKWMPEATLDFGIFTSHPKTSKRMMEVYKYIYKKYPWALDSEMIHNVNYVNFVNSSQKEIKEFQQEEKVRETERKNKYSL